MEVQTCADLAFERLGSSLDVRCTTHCNLGRPTRKMLLEATLRAWQRWFRPAKLQEASASGSYLVTHLELQITCRQPEPTARARAATRPLLHLNLPPPSSTAFTCPSTSDRFHWWPLAISTFMGFTFWESPVFPGVLVTAYVLAVPVIAVGALQTHSLSDAFRCLFSAVSAPILEMQAPIWSACRALWYFFYIIPHTSDFFQTVYTCSPNYTQDNIQCFTALLVISKWVSLTWKFQGRCLIWKKLVKV